MTATEPAPPSTTSLARQMVNGSAWTVAARWGDRFIGLVSTVVLARLLTPTDYGIVAIATLFIGFVEVFFNTGQTAVMVRHPNPTREHFDTS